MHIDKYFTNFLILALTYLAIGIINPNIIKQLHGIMIFNNPSISIASGHYLVNFGKVVNRGDDCVVCIPLVKFANIAKNKGLPTSNLCPFGVAPLLKHVVASTGDIIEISKEIKINGRVLSILPINSSNIPKKYTLKSNQYFVVGDVQNSFDSRYFGIVSGEFILGKAKRVW